MILVFTLIVILVYYLVVIEDQDLLFKLNKILVTLFVQLVNKNIKIVLARNNSEKLVFLLHNFCLRNLIDIKYNNSFLVLNIDITNLVTYFPKDSAFKIPQLSYKDLEIEIKYYISTIIYEDIKITRIFFNLLDEFLENLFNNIGFIDLLEDYQIKINLYLN